MSKLRITKSGKNVVATITRHLPEVGYLRDATREEIKEVRRAYYQALTKAGYLSASDITVEHQLNFVEQGSDVSVSGYVNKGVAT